MRLCLRLLPIGVLALCLACCTSPSILSIQVIPGGATLTALGQTSQFKAIATFVRSGGRGEITEDVTTQVLWASSTGGVATINSSGLATAAMNGTTTITASMGSAVGTATLTVQGSGQGSGQALRDLASITVIPNSQTVTSTGEQAQFIAIGTFTAAPTTQDLTDSVQWQSSDAKIATVNSVGLALSNTCTANPPCSATISAIGTDNSGALIVGTATFAFNNTGGGGVTLPQLTVVQVGLGSGTVTSIGGAGVGGVINCPPTGGAACTGNFPLGTTVMLTATPSAGSTFGGWSANCMPDTAATPTCTVVMNNNEPVGVIFNAN